MPFDRSKPAMMMVKAAEDHIVLHIGTVTIGLEPAVARELAESLLGAVGKVEGKEFILMTAGYMWDTIKGRHPAEECPPERTDRPFTLSDRTEAPDDPSQQ